MNWIQSHALYIAVAWYAFSAAVDAMPAPAPMGSRWYAFGYTFAHLFAGNLAHVKTRLFPHP
jgi:hypothetical protein